MTGKPDVVILPDKVLKGSITAGLLRAPVDEGQSIGDARLIEIERRILAIEATVAAIQP